MRISNKLKCILRCIKNRNNQQFVQRVLEINKNDNLVDISKLGDANYGTPFYYIYFPETGNGFFAEFRKVLNACYFADMFGLLPVVEFSREFSYAEKEEFLGTYNPFEYYFEQPCGKTLSEVKNSSCVINYRAENINPAERLKPEGGYASSNEYEDIMAGLMKKYIRLNRTTQDKLAEDLQELRNAGRVLGVHVRGTDFKKEYNRHPNFVTAEEYLERAIEIVSRNGFDKVFLATDDATAVQLFQEAFGERLIYFKDVIRSDGTQSVMLSERTEREHHKYLLGYEVLRDMYALSECDGLVAGLSQVSICARIAKKSYDKEYDVLEVLDKGIAHNNKSCIDDIEKARKK